MTKIDLRTGAEQGQNNERTPGHPEFLQSIEGGGSPCGSTNALDGAVEYESMRGRLDPNAA